ncbi:hypothetical protein [Moorena sp. SIO3B2]|uniref:hypothetical protein n=1 Tax=Moorena sp. SIO3B2 TaxID=2607827 RepID=UPI002579DEF8|nr:hypothetical protein [Moorena sp. SIO3B2]
MEDISKQPAEKQILETIPLVEQPQPLSVKPAPCPNYGHSPEEFILPIIVLIRVSPTLIRMLITWIRRLITLIRALVALIKTLIALIALIRVLNRLITALNQLIILLTGLLKVVLPWWRK